jgi:hypothetical protein
VQVPALAPWLSSYWVLFVTRAQWSVAREVVVGLTEDLVADGAAYWQLIRHDRRQSFAEAAQAALAEEREPLDTSTPLNGLWAAMERWMQRYWRAKSGAAS